MSSLGPPLPGRASAAARAITTIVNDATHPWRSRFGPWLFSLTFFPPPSRTQHNRLFESMRDLFGELIRPQSGQRPGIRLILFSSVYLLECPPSPWESAMLASASSSG